MQSRYGAEKIAEVTRTLARHPAAAHQRLKDSLVALMAVKVSDFPEDLQQDYTELMKRLRQEAPGENGRIPNTIDKMSDGDVQEIIDKILEMNYRLSQE